MPFSFPASPTVGQTSAQNGRTYIYTSYGTWELTGNVSGHAASHTSDGSDPITPASIGAAAASHTHSYSSLTGVPTSFTPSAHASSHAAGGTDALTLTSSQISDFATAAAAAAPATTNASLLTSGTLADARLTANVVLTGDSRLSNSRTPTGAAGGDLTGTYPNPQIAAGAVTEADLANAVRNSMFHPFLLMGG